MLNILAETSTGMAIGGGGLLGATVVALLVRRTGNKILDHVDNGEIHVRPNNGYISKEFCLERSENLEKELVEQRASITTIQLRIDKAIKSQESGVEKILAAIQNSADK